MRHLFIMDPIADIDIGGDSTFALMLEAAARGDEVLYADQRDLSLAGGKPSIIAQTAEVSATVGDHARLGPRETHALDDLTSVFMRKDPPIGIDYLTSTMLLDRMDRSKVVPVNDPQGLRDCNEKLYTLQWSHLMPKTIVARNMDTLRAFIAAEGDTVVKPLDGAGGAGIVRLSKGDKNIGSILDLLTSGGRVAIMAQAFLPAVTEGDRRILIIGGEPIGVINRRPGDDDLRSNMHVGGTAEPAKLSDRDREICAELGPDLVRRGLPFVGIDVIGGHLTEINVTSPTGFVELQKFEGVNGAAILLDWVAERARQLQN